MNLKWMLLQGVRNAEGAAGGGSGSDGGAPAGGAAGNDSGAPSDGGAPAAGGSAGSAEGAKPAEGFAVAVDGTVPAANAQEGDGDKPKEGEEGADKDVKKDEPEPELKAEDYKFVLPDGAEPDPAQAQEFTQFCLDHKVPPEQAQAMVDFHAQILGKQVKAWTDQVSAWGEETRNDPEYGGAEYEQNMGIANRALLEFGGPKLGEAARQYGWGNHPEFVRFMVNVGKALGAPSTEKGGGQGNMGTSIPLHQALYPGMK
ncbi:hypothetical protein [Microvirga mediterraneensis]|uniref:Endoprotease n=1 Tax=Microvirga mediterraneensis TaxID=2754695 RepID=A0A838BVC2_9HYPH|nr:hypothetical protein [Microvirga mediterraneensis]MBA1159381.1 hypothetical protein [Microvirga mediterraneensis]